MSTYQEIIKGIPEQIDIPAAFEKLCYWTDKNGYPISGQFELRADDGETMRYWLGFDNVSHRFGLFGAGGDGSLYAFWIDDDGRQKIVHMGSEGDHVYILADDFIDFLRLLAIGYDEIGHADLGKPVREWNIEIEQEEDNGINPAFREWVEKEFGVRVPDTGSEIVDVDDHTFSNWIEEQLDKFS